MLIRSKLRAALAKFTFFTGEAILAAPHSADLLRLDNQLCFALYAATRAMTRTYRERLEPLGLTYPQYLVLLVLWETDGLTVSALGNRLMLDSGTLTPLIKRLESAGLVFKQRRTEDEREVEVWLTDGGRVLQVAVAGAREHVVCRLQMNETEIGKLRGELMDMIGRLSEERSVAPASV